MSAQNTILRLEHAHPDPRVASLLPSDIAQRCHAVPIAADGQRITVAMEHPEDPVSRQTVVDSLGPETCVVQASPEEMARMLNELWPTNTESKLHFISWEPAEESVTALVPYTRTFAGLMDARLTCITCSEADRRPRDYLSAEIRRQQPDLLIIPSLVSPAPPWWLQNLKENQFIKQIPLSLLIAQNPRLPLRKILLVLRDSKYDNAAVNWVLQIASKSKAAVTILPLIAPAPPVYAGINLQQRSLIHLLGSTCPLGETLRQVSKCLVEQNVKGTLRLQEGTIVEQIQQEVEEGEYDLAVIAADARCSIVCWMMGELINPLLNIAKIPTLLAKPS
jgi:hypothetical protein